MVFTVLRSATATLRFTLSKKVVNQIERREKRKDKANVVKC